MSARLSDFVSRLGEASVARRWPVIVAVLLMVVAAGWVSGPLPQLLKGGVGSVPGSGSERVQRVLAEDFESPFAQFLLVVLGPSTDETREGQAVMELTTQLSDHADVTRVMHWPTEPDEPTVLVVGVEAPTLDATERLVPVIREAVSGVAGRYPDMQVVATGQAAFNVDLAAYASEQSALGEKRVFPFTLLALLLAFGTMGAAISPLLAGTAAVVAALGILALVAQAMPLSVYASNIASMLGIGLGIDYALFVVSRIREEAEPGLAPQEAVRRAIRHAAPAVALSAGTVLIGLLALVTVPVQDMIGMGIGGAVVAATSALMGLTLLPALAAAMGRWLDAPHAARRRRSSEERALAWEARVRLAVDRPWLALGVAVAVLVFMSLPMRHVSFGYPEIRMMPAAMEAIRGWHRLASLEAQGALMPIRLLIQAPAGEPVLTPARIAGMKELVGQLKADERVSEVRALADPAYASRLAAGAVMLGPERLRERLPEEGQWALSRKGDATLVEVIVKDSVGLQDLKRLCRDLASRDWRGIRGMEGLVVSLGGASALDNDIEDMAMQSLPRVIAIVLLATLGMLYAMTRSVLIPLKAVLANLLTVCASLGATLFMFQSPWASKLLGLSEPLATIAPGIPILVFSVVFGLSMDYEVFLIARILEAHRKGMGDRDAILKGVGRSAGVITSAAVIMAIVFGGFALTDMVMVKMLGVALALGVLLDATVVRLLLVPALMGVAGRYNWWPGERKT